MTMDQRAKRFGEWTAAAILAIGITETLNPCVNVVVAGIHASHPVYPISPLVGVSELFLAIFVWGLGCVAILLRPSDPVKRPLNGREPGADGINGGTAGTDTRRTGEGH